MNTAATTKGPSPERERVGYAVRERVAVLTIDNPPVNASSSAVRAGLLEGISRARQDGTADSVVIIGAGGNFVSGSDLQEFSAELLPKPELPEVIHAIENCPKPVIAAISGAALGGGLELALGCDWRIALEGCTVGLPEITLGMIPGAGGTQRTLRLLGPGRTLAFATSGHRHRITPGETLGLVDRVVAGDLLEEAVRFAHEAQGKRILTQGPIPGHEPGEVEDAARAAISGSGGRPEVIAAVGAVLAGLALPPAMALAHERAEFTRLRNGDEAAALRHQFFARRTALKANRPKTSTPLHRVAVVGTGTMGLGIARAFIDSGAAASVYDENPASAAGAVHRLRDAYRRLIAGGRLTQQEADERMGRLHVAGSLEDLGGADLYVEAVFEDLAVKMEVLTRLEAVADGAPMATNTSYLDIEALSQALADPRRLMGMHFFSPAHRTPVLEVVRAQRTSPPDLDAAFTAARLLEKVPIVAGVCDGFIGNRIYNAYRRQCELMLEEGALPAEVDAALTAFGFAMGPFAVADMSGLDIAWRMRKSKASGRDPRERYPDVADRLCERGWFGQKAGRGWYRYGQDGRTPAPDPEVEGLIREASIRKGIERRRFTAGEISRRALLAMANEAALVLSEGIAERASDVDLMLVLGYGFPARKGGIAFWARRQDQGRLAEEQSELARLTGHGFRAADLSYLGA